MSTAIETLTAWFRSQVGTRELGENNVIYNTHYYGSPVTGSDYPWCVTFVWDGFREAGLSPLFCGGAKTAYCPYVMDWARQHGQWVTDGYREGDLLLYDQDGDGTVDHIGYCAHAAPLRGVITSIEGNYSNAVAEVKRMWISVLGAYRPAYPAADTPAPETPSQPQLDADGMYTVQPGDTLWGLAERYLGNGVRFGEIMEANGLLSDKLLQGQRLRLPGMSSPAAMATITVTIAETTLQTLQRLAGSKSIGEYLDTVFAE